MTPGGARRRLDTELVRRGLVTTREQAAALVESGSVLVGGVVAEKVSRLVASSDPVVLSARPRFVSRGGDKLQAALETFGIDVAGKLCLDAGASTGGFTDCMLQGGAAHVVAVDVGRGQLHPRIRSSSRVTVLERTNVRHLRSRDVLLRTVVGEPIGKLAREGDGEAEGRVGGEVGGEVGSEVGSEVGRARFEVVVADLSFISLTLVLPVLAGELAAPGADLVLLVKPQFEAGRSEVSRGRGVIRDPEVRAASLMKVASAARACRASIIDVMASPVPGPAGNVEFFIYGRAHSSESEKNGSRLEDLVAKAVGGPGAPGPTGAPEPGAP